MRTEYKHLSRRARALLAHSESVDVEFKRSLSGLDTSDLVAFANSHLGGAILIGVNEVTAPDGRQVGDIVGCDVGDASKLTILNRALSCVPPVRVHVIVENMSRTPFYRIEIPGSDSVPHCTSGGTYKVRDDGRVRALHPEALLAIYLHREGAEFRNRFSEATKEIGQHLAAATSSMDEIEGTISSGLSSIEDELGWAVYHARDAGSDIDDVHTKVRWTLERSDELNERLGALLKHLDAEDPVKDRAKKELQQELETTIRERPDLLESLKKGEGVTLRSQWLRLLTKEESQAVLLRAALAVLRAEATDPDGGDPGADESE